MIEFISKALSVMRCAELTEWGRKTFRASCKLPERAGKKAGITPRLDFLQLRQQFGLETVGHHVAEGAFRLLGDRGVFRRHGRKQRINGLLIVGFVEHAR